MTSLQQVESNRRNAQLSTGPQTEEGKLRVRGNAWRHGLAGQGISWQEREAEELACRRADWQNRLHPGDPTELWLIELIATETLRWERCRQHEQALIAEESERATLCWSDDRRVAAEQLATRLAREPALICHQLRQSSAGCQWLRERWLALDQIVVKTGSWTAAQVSLAYDLLGVPPALRNGSTVLDPPAGEKNPMEWIRNFIRSQVADLDERREGALDTIDAHQRTHAEQGFFAEPARALTLVRRYEAACLRRLQWALSHFVEPRSASSTSSEPAALPGPEPASETPAERPCIDAAEVSITPRAEAEPAADATGAQAETNPPPAAVASLVAPAEPPDLLAEAFCDRVRRQYPRSARRRGRDRDHRHTDLTP